MGARQYDSTTNRFTQTDPSGKETNPYLYTGGDPINRTDPTGLGFLSSLSGILDSSNDWVGAAIGCIGGMEAAADTGAIEYAAAVGGVAGAGVGSAVGAGVAVVGSCAVGAVAGYYNTDLLTYG